MATHVMLWLGFIPLYTSKKKNCTMSTSYGVDATTLRLCCMRIGDASDPFIVETSPNATIAELKEVIMEKTGMTAPPPLVTLFLAKREGVWLSTESEEYKTLKRLRTDRVRDVILDQDSLNPRLTVGNVFLPSYSTTEAQPSLPIHVFAIEQEMVNRLRNELGALEQRSSGSKRQRELNEILDANKKAKLKADGTKSTPFSHVTWSGVKHLFKPSLVSAPRKLIPEACVDFILKYLKVVTKVLGHWSDTTKEAKRYHFIAPVLICICEHIGDSDANPSAKLLIEHTIAGNEVHGHGNFEFLIEYNGKKICIVEAKNSDFNQGAAQALVGCEVIADCEHLDIVCGIVTDCTKWEIYRVGTTKIEKGTVLLNTASDGMPEKESLRALCETIYALLSEVGGKAQDEEVVGVA